MSKGEIRNPQAYVEAALRRRTQRFDGCFPRGISFGDIDSFVEINKHFLILEWKRSDQVVPTGQWIAFQRFASLPKVSIWIVWTDDDGTITRAQSVLHHSNPKKITEESLAAAIERWVTEAEAAND